MPEVARWPLHGVSMIVTLIGVHCMGCVDGYQPEVVSNFLEHGQQVAPMRTSSLIKGKARLRKKDSGPLTEKGHNV